MALVEHIREDLARRIGGRGKAPAQWTLAALAAEYGVSVTPVRQALAELVDQGIVERLSNGRLQPAETRQVARRAGGRTAGRRRPVAPAAQDDVALTEQVERDVLRRSLRGEHEFLREEAFAERLDVGRTRLRRVLLTLAGAGVIEHIARRGFRARPFQRDDMLAFLDVRATLEAQALDLARGRLDERELRRIANGNDADAVAAGVIDNALHGYFVQQADNHYLAAFFASHGRYYSRLFDFAAVDAERLEEMAGQHCEILEHAQSRRWARARNALRHHIHSQAPVLTAAIERLTATKTNRRNP